MYIALFRVLMQLWYECAFLRDCMLRQYGGMIGHTCMQAAVRLRIEDGSLLQVGGVVLLLLLTIMMMMLVCHGACSLCVYTGCA